MAALGILLLCVQESAEGREGTRRKRKEGTGLLIAACVSLLCEERQRAFSYSVLEQKTSANEAVAARQKEKGERNGVARGVLKPKKSERRMRSFSFLTHPQLISLELWRQ